MPSTSSISTEIQQPLPTEQIIHPTPPAEDLPEVRVQESEEMEETVECRPSTSASSSTNDSENKTKVKKRRSRAELSIELLELD